MAQKEATVTAIKAFTDNYIWAIGTSASNEMALVDPGEASVCIEYLEQQQLMLSAILITHHHSDHVGGINELLAYNQQKNRPLTIYGPAKEPIPHRTIALQAHDELTVPGIDMQFSIIELPGHTAGHIAYYNQNAALLFCGDTLFSGGCGRLFEGTATQMFHSLTTLAQLPNDTKVYCAHEYTQANLKFALTLEPGNQQLIDYYQQVSAQRIQGIATIPSTIAIEKSINPFLRCDQTQIQQQVQRQSNLKSGLKMPAVFADEPAIKTFAAMRTLKDHF